MLWEKSYQPAMPEASFRSLVEAWDQPDKKVFVLRASENVSDIKELLIDNFQYLGKPVALAEDVKIGDRDHQRSGELWFEVRYDPKHPDAYRHSANAQPLHTDGSYIPDFPNATLLSCVANAGTGGETIFLDARDLVSCLQQENSELLERLSNYEMPHARSGDKRTEPVIETQDDSILVNWNYYCVDKEIDNEGRELAELFFTYLDESTKIKSKILAVKLAPGDAVTWKDREVLHGRNSFVANQESERFIWKCAIDIGNFAN